MKMHHFVIPPMATLVGLYVLFKRRRRGLVGTDDASTVATLQIAGIIIEGRLQESNQR
jgi:hypothetical protein